MKRVPVTQHASLTSDRVPEFAGEREYLATGSVDDDGLLAPKLVTYESRPSRADLSAKLGDVCFARMQATRKVLRIDEAGAEAILSTGFAVLRPNPEYLYSGYLRSWVASDAFQFAKDRLCTGATQKAIQYEKKVEAYLKNHLDHIAIHRLRTNQPLTATDMLGLERTLAEIGEDDGQTLLTGLLARSEEPSLAHFVRNMVGMDRAAAQRAFSGFLSDQSLTPPQIRFVEMVIDQLTARGVMEA